MLSGRAVYAVAPVLRAHESYCGDFLTIRELRGGELRFDGYHRPEWPSNRASAGAGTGAST